LLTQASKHGLNNYLTLVNFPTPSSPGLTKDIPTFCVHVSLDKVRINSCRIFRVSGGIHQMFHNSSTILLQFFYDYSTVRFFPARIYMLLREKTLSVTIRNILPRIWYSPNPSTILPQNCRNLFCLPHYVKLNNCEIIVERFCGPSSGNAAGKNCGRIVTKDFAPG
jgi:hypothetical protein